MWPFRTKPPPAYCDTAIAKAIYQLLVEPRDAKRAGENRLEILKANQGALHHLLTLILERIEAMSAEMTALNTNLAKLQTDVTAKLKEKDDKIAALQAQLAAADPAAEVQAAADAVAKIDAAVEASVTA